MLTSDYPWPALASCGIRRWFPDPAYPWHGRPASPESAPWSERQRAQFDYAAQLLGLELHIEPLSDGRFKLVEQRRGGAVRLPAPIDGESKRQWWAALCALTSPS